MSRHLLTALAALQPVLRAQHGTVTTPQAARVGVTRQSLGRLCDADLLERLFRGVYRSVAFPETWWQRAVALSQFAGARAPLSHRAAARWHDLRHLGVGGAPILELTVVEDGWRPDVPARVHTSRYLDLDRDVVRDGAVHVTTVAWTLRAVATSVAVDRLERAVDAAIAARQVRTFDLRELGHRLAGCPGAPVFAEVLDRLHPTTRWTRSEVERVFLRLLRAAGLPLPDANVRVTDAAGRRRYLDFAFRDLHIAIEIDAHPSHGRRLGLMRDGHRQNDLVGRWLILRFDAEDLRRRPDEVVRQVRNALVAAGAAL